MDDIIMWKTAVEMWLHHITNDYVEKTLLTALDINHGDIPETIDWLTAHGYASLLGLYGAGGPDSIHIDVGGNLRAPDFLQVFFPTWNDIVTSISLADILKYLKSGKKEVAVQLSLL